MMFYLVMKNQVARKKLQLRKMLTVVQVGSLLSQNLRRVHRDSIVVVKCSTMKRCILVVVACPLSTCLLMQMS